MLNCIEKSKTAHISFGTTKVEFASSYKLSGSYRPTSDVLFKGKVTVSKFVVIAYVDVSPAFHP